MKKEVFSEILEAEMIMTGLCDEEFERMIPEDIIDEQNRGLLKRMNILKQQIMTRRNYSLGELDQSLDSSSLPSVAAGDKGLASKAGEDDAKTSQSGAHGSIVSQPAVDAEVASVADAAKAKKKTSRRLRSKLNSSGRSQLLSLDHL